MLVNFIRTPPRTSSSVPHHGGATLKIASYFKIKDCSLLENPSLCVFGGKFLPLLTVQLITEQDSLWD